jgi:uncharacterized protein
MPTDAHILRVAPLTLTVMQAFASVLGLARSTRSGVRGRGQRLVNGVCAMAPSRSAVRALSAGAGVSSRPRNVLGNELGRCCLEPKTGFYRDGYCQTGPEDAGKHTVCAIVTDEFLSFSKARGNDLSTPLPTYQFPGLKSGDKWCLCVLRWKEALDAGVAPKIVLASTHEHSLAFISLDDLKTHAAD